MVKKILIIEDEPDIAETMKMLIEKEGYAVMYVLDPRKGLQLMKKFDLLLLDIMMPTMSGREILAEMKKQKIKIPVIVVSAVGMPMEIARELSDKYPGTEFVAKTEMHTTLIASIKKKIGR